MHRLTQKVMNANSPVDKKSILDEMTRNELRIVASDLNLYVNKSEVRDETIARLCEKVMRPSDRLRMFSVGPNAAAVAAGKSTALQRQDTKGEYRFAIPLEQLRSNEVPGAKIVAMVDRNQTVI